MRENILEQVKSQILNMGVITENLLFLRTIQVEPGFEISLVINYVIGVLESSAAQSLIEIDREIEN